MPNQARSCQASRRADLHRDLQNLLDQIRQGGEVDSAGEFTIDQFSAARKLARTQFPTPYLYAVKLVQWAVASGASMVRIAIWPGSFQLVHDGLPIGDQLPELVRWALSSPTGSERRYVHLASAILALQVLSPSRVDVFSQGQCLRVAQGKDQLKSVRPSTSDRIHVSGLALRGNSDSLQLLMEPALGLVGTVRPEVGMLVHHCAYSEIPVYLNGAPLCRALLGSRQHTPRVVKGRTRLYIPSGSHSMPIRVALMPAGDTAGISVPGPETGGVFSRGRFWMREQPEVFQPLGRPKACWPSPPEAVVLPHISLADFPMFRGWAILLDYQGTFEHALTAAFRSNLIQLVQDGVIIETVQPRLNESRLQAEGIVATGLLPLDLSHFRFVRSEQFISLIEEVVHLLELGR
ncbi:hypothetical protein DYH09_09630 [bacterium CPR1]|nr:hypothetical protein [bacterium CPR1]